MDLMKELLSELLKLLITGVLGGIVGSFIGLKVFRAQKRIETKYQDLIQKREILRDVIVLLHGIYHDIIVDWEQPINANETPQEHISNIIASINRWKTHFLDDDKIYKSFEKLYSLVGAPKDMFYGINSKEGDLPGRVIGEIRETLEKKITEIDKLLA